MEPPQPKTPGLAIRLQRRRPHDFGQLSGIQPAQDVHLPKTILCGDVPLHEKCILQIRRADVWLAERIERGGEREP